MKVCKVFFGIGVLFSLIGMLIGVTQQRHYQMVLLTNGSPSNISLNDKHEAFRMPFTLQLAHLEFEQYDNGAIRQIHATLIGTHQKQQEHIRASINHPASYQQYKIYLEKYWKSGNGGIQLMLKYQPLTWMVYLGIIFIIISSLWYIFTLFFHNNSIKNSWFLGVFILLTGTIFVISSPTLHNLHFPPILQSIWFIPHVLFYILSYALLAAGLVVAIFAIRGRTQKLAKSIQLLQAGSICFTIGLCLGMIWANQAWGSFWNWDPKETAALITWGYYLILHVLIGRRDISCKTNLLLQILGIILVIFCWFGVQLFKMGGLHIY